MRCASLQAGMATMAASWVFEAPCSSDDRPTALKPSLPGLAPAQERIVSKVPVSSCRDAAERMLFRRGHILKSSPDMDAGAAAGSRIEKARKASMFGNSIASKTYFDAGRYAGFASASPMSSRVLNLLAVKVCAFPLAGISTTKPLTLIRGFADLFVEPL